MAVQVIVDNVAIQSKLAKLIDDDVKRFAQYSFYKHMAKFIPRDTGLLMTTMSVNLGGKTTRLDDATIRTLAQSSGNITVDGVRFTAPYAIKMYFGDGFNFRRDMNPLAMSHWDKGVDKEVLSREIERYIRTRKVNV